ncbi:hypothetical protein GJ688_09865 [Heliobacillus mobilis]|uniref:Helix-turn-helix domain-containing protein n=1 Tax=Heliobacterium mobile TaxID=28064 RepID=A0A6I3SK70_HELMO|nr:helix-turn-helix domain-containing protein [Heliobacterium mobile]MTV49283.1 hypothetical protein [Heliobacterium mobile]
MDKWYTVDDIVGRMKVSKERVLTWILAGMLSATDLEGKGDYRIRQQDLDLFLARQKDRTYQALEKVRARVEEETIVLGDLYDWLQQENGSLSSLYKQMDDCLLQVVEQFKSQWDSARQSGEHIRARAFQDALTEVYQRWERPKQIYQQWLINQEKRWQLFIAQLGPLLESNAGLVTPSDPFLAIHMSELNTNNSTPDILMETKKRNRDFYQALYLWAKRENTALREHYERMERCISRIVEALQNSAKKASKNMEFERGQSFQDAANIAYYQWEQSRSVYNQWLLGFHERWQTCQSTVKLNLAKFRQEMGRATEDQEPPDPSYEQEPFDHGPDLV